MGRQNFFWPEPENKTPCLFHRHTACETAGHGELTPTQCNSPTKLVVALATKNDEQYVTVSREMTSAKALRAGSISWESGARDQTVDSRLVLELYDQEQASLRRYLYFLGLDTDTAEETLQESFLKLHEHLLGGGERANLRAWLYRVCHNLARNLQVSLEARRTDRLASMSADMDPVAPGTSAEEELVKREQKERLWRAIEMLSPAQRDSLVLRSQGLKYREIADMLGLSTSTVAENVARGLEELKEML